jgi:exosortase family protein XrtG
MIWVQPIVTVPLTKLVAMVSGEIGELTGMYDSYYQYSMLFIPKSTAAVSLYVDLECSGVIEMMAFLSLLWFFEVYNLYEKVIVSILGTLGIFLANVVRIFVICAMIFKWGNDIFYFAHSIFGRIIFYLFTIALYFYVFTKSQIVRQQVGNFSYGDQKEKKEDKEKLSQKDGEGI